MPPKGRVSLAGMLAEPEADMASVHTLAQEHAAPAPSSQDEAHASANGKPYKRVGLYLDPTVKREIDTIAFTHERKPHDLYLEAIDLLLKKYGRASILELEKKA